MIPSIIDYRIPMVDPHEPTFSLLAQKVCLLCFFINKINFFLGAWWICYNFKFKCSNLLCNRKY